MSNRQMARQYMAEQYLEDPAMMGKILVGTSSNVDVQRGVVAVAQGGRHG